ncbi:MAG: pathogenesis-related family 1 protein, partial [Gammaproteobacteria bacterium]
SQTLLAGHNAARAAVGVPPLRWSDALARYAGDRAAQLGREGCSMRHRMQGRYGENLAWSSGRSLSPGAVVGLWVSERFDYDPRANRCRHGKRCGHYSQVVWRTSAWLGCAVARCARSEVWVCIYDPPGNYVGERPY